MKLRPGRQRRRDPRVFRLRAGVFETIESEFEKNLFQRKGVSAWIPICTKRTAPVLFRGACSDQLAATPQAQKLVEHRTSSHISLSRVRVGAAGFGRGGFAGKRLILGWDGKILSGGERPRWYQPS
jgi:hypothetical protein